MDVRALSLASRLGTHDATTLTTMSERRTTEVVKLWAICDFQRSGTLIRRIDQLQVGNTSLQKTLGNL
jgi:hypothetical protein